MKSYWGPLEGKSRWSVEKSSAGWMPGLLTHLEGELSMDKIDFLIIKQRIKEITKKIGRK